MKVKVFAPVEHDLVRVDLFLFLRRIGRKLTKIEEEMADSHTEDSVSRTARMSHAVVNGSCDEEEHHQQQKRHCEEVSTMEAIYKGCACCTARN